MIIIQIILGITLVLTLIWVIAKYKIKWYMQKNPPHAWEMNGKHITDEYFERMRQELNER